MTATYRHRLNDRTGLSYLEPRVHVKITNPNHGCTGMTGTVVRVELDRRKVWISLPDGRTVPAGHRSVEVMP